MLTRIQTKNTLLHLEGRDIHFAEMKNQIELVEGCFPGKRGQITYTICTHDSGIVIKAVYVKMVDWLKRVVTEGNGLFILDMEALLKETIKEVSK